MTPTILDDGVIDQQLCFVADLEWRAGEVLVHVFLYPFTASCSMQSLVTEPIFEHELERLRWLGQLSVLVGVNHEQVELDVGTQAFDHFAGLSPARAQSQRAIAIRIGTHPHIVALRAW